jgi:hypothetical protein
MDIEIIYSLKEYQEIYTISLDKYLLEYEESEKIDFVNSEIKKYSICLHIINFPKETAFNRFFRIESKWMDLQAFSLTQEILDFIFSNENDNYYFKMYHDLIGSHNGTSGDCERKVIQTRLIFPKIISFLQNKKSELDAVKTETEKLSVKQIALKLAYEEVDITKENANGIIQKYGYTSGHNLYQEYNKVWSSKKRITDPNETLKVLLNKIDLFESVAEIVSPELKEKVEDEIKLLKSYIIKY